MDHLAQPVDKDQNTRSTEDIGWEAKDKVHANGLPAVAGNWQALKRSLRVRCRLHSLTNVTRFDVCTYPLVHISPPKIAG